MDERSKRERGSSSKKKKSTRPNNHQNRNSNSNGAIAVVDGGLSREELEVRRIDAELQTDLVKLYLRYRGMRVPFALLPLWPVLFLIFAFTFYDVDDYYMEVFFRELVHVYLFCFILLFMRREPFYC